MGFYCGAKYLYMPEAISISIRHEAFVGNDMRTPRGRSSGTLHILHIIIVCVCTWELSAFNVVIVRRTPGRSGPSVKLPLNYAIGARSSGTPFTLFLFTNDVSKYFSFRIYILVVFCFFFPSPEMPMTGPLTNRARAINLHISPERRSN